MSVEVNPEMRDIQKKPMQVSPSQRRTKKISPIAGLSGTQAKAGSRIDFRLSSNNLIDLSSHKFYMEASGWDKFFHGIDTRSVVDYLEIEMMNKRFQWQNVDEIAQILSLCVEDDQRIAFERRLRDERSQARVAEAGGNHFYQAGRCQALNLVDLPDTGNDPDITAVLDGSNYLNGHFRNGFDIWGALAGNANPEDVYTPIPNNGDWLLRFGPAVKHTFSFKLNHIGLMACDYELPARWMGDIMIRIGINSKQNKFFNTVIPISATTQIVKLRSPYNNLAFDFKNYGTIAQPDLTVWDCWMTVDEVIRDEATMREYESLFNSEGLSVNLDENRVVLGTNPSTSNPTFVFNERRKWLNYILLGRRNDTKTQYAPLNGTYPNFLGNKVVDKMSRFERGSLRDYMVKLNNINMADDRIIVKDNSKFKATTLECPAYDEFLKVSSFMQRNQQLNTRVVSQDAFLRSKFVVSQLFSNYTDKLKDMDLLNAFDNTTSTGTIVVETNTDLDDSQNANGALTNYACLINYSKVLRIKSNGVEEMY